MGLNNSIKVRSQTPLMFPVPTINQAYVMLMTNESVRVVVASTRILQATPVMFTGHFESTSLYS